MQSYAETDAELMASGQWRDPATGLIWMRCSIGQTWTGSSCSGNPTDFSWQDAHDYFQLFNQQGFARHKNWRFPRIEELVSIRLCSTGYFHEVVTEFRPSLEGHREFKVDKGIENAILPNGVSVPVACANDRRSPTLDNRIFPNTPESGFWSISSYVLRDDYAWLLFFGHGVWYISSKDDGSYVRAVRNP